MNKDDSYYITEIRKLIQYENWNDFDYVLNRVKEDGLALQNASEKLRNNPEIVFEAIKQNTLALYWSGAWIKRKIFA